MNFTLIFLLTYIASAVCGLSVVMLGQRDLTIRRALAYSVVFGGLGTALMMLIIDMMGGLK